MPLAQIAVPLAVLLVGAVVYVMASASPPAPTPQRTCVAEMGRAGVWIGLFWLVGTFAQHVLKF